MDMRCSVYLRPESEREEMRKRRIEKEQLTYFDAATAARDKILRDISAELEARERK